MLPRVRCQLVRIGIGVLLLAGCGSPTAPPTATPLSPSPTPWPDTPTPAPTATLPPPLTSDPGPYQDATALLDGVCYDYLARLNGTTWVWTSATDLADFYDRVDASEVCSHPATRQTVDFGASVLVGLVSATTGCDAAYRVLDLLQDDQRRTQTLRLSLEVRAGCPYELIEPLVLAVPPPPSGYILQTVIVTP